MYGKIGLIFRTPMDPGKDASNCLKLGTAFLVLPCLHYRQLGCAKRVVNYWMLKLLKPAFAAQIHSAQRLAPNRHVLRVFHTMGLAAHTMGLVAHTIGLAALLGDGLILEFMVMCRARGSSRAVHSIWSASDLSKYHTMAQRWGRLQSLMQTQLTILVISCFSALVCLHPEPELKSLVQCLHLVSPGMLHNRAWHWLAQDVTIYISQWNLIHIYTIPSCQLSIEIMKSAARAWDSWLVQCSQCDCHQAIACSRGLIQAVQSSDAKSSVQDPELSSRLLQLPENTCCQDCSTKYYVNNFHFILLFLGKHSNLMWTTSAWCGKSEWISQLFFRLFFSFIWFLPRFACIWICRDISNQLGWNNANYFRWKHQIQL
jgi:hypothetical protein